MEKILVGSTFIAFGLFLILGRKKQSREALGIQNKLFGIKYSHRDIAASEYGYVATGIFFVICGLALIFDIVNLRQ